MEARQGEEEEEEEEEAELEEAEAEELEEEEELGPAVVQGQRRPVRSNSVAAGP